MMYFFILHFHYDLMVIIVCIYETYLLVTSNLIYQYINVKKGLVVLWISFVKSDKVYTNYPLIIGLLYEHKISNHFV